MYEILRKEGKGTFKSAQLVSGKRCGILITSFLFHVTVLENSILIMCFGNRLFIQKYYIYRECGVHSRLEVCQAQSVENRQSEKEQNTCLTRSSVFIASLTPRIFFQMTVPVTVAVLVLDTCHPVDNTIGFPNTYPLDSDLSPVSKV